MVDFVLPAVSIVPTALVLLSYSEHYAFPSETFLRFCLLAFRSPDLLLSSSLNINRKGADVSRALALSGAFLRRLLLCSSFHL